MTYVITYRWEATSGFEPLVQLLQSRALPLGDVAWNRMERETGIEPATFSLARRCSTTEPLPHDSCVCKSKVPHQKQFVNSFLFVTLPLFNLSPVFPTVKTDQESYYSSNYRGYY